MNFFFNYKNVIGEIFFEVYFDMSRWIDFWQCMS